MISRQNFEIRTVLLQELPSCEDNFSRLSQFFSAQDSIHGFVTRLQNGIFSSPSIIDIIIDAERYL